MKVRIALIRHGETENAAGRLIGATNDPLSENGKNLIREKCAAKAYPIAKHVYSDELLCCRETANLIYQSPVVMLKELNAPDYGDFDGQALTELFQDVSFADWMKTKTLGAFPNGGILYDANAKAWSVIRKICAVMEKKNEEQCAVISHKMIILAILRRYCVPRSSYADWEIPFGGGYLIEYDTIELTASLIGKI